MDQLQAMRTFVRVAERGSFSAVARELNSTQSQISRQVAQLEERLGATLLTRSTRQVALTPEGSTYLEFARRALNETDEGSAALRGGQQSLRGSLRISASASIWEHLAFPPLRDLMRAHPELSLDVQLNDARVDLVTEGIDLAIRGGTLDDSGLVARQLGELAMVVVASRSYLTQSADSRPAIVTPMALEQHECLSFSLWRDARWRFEDEQGRVHAVNVTGRWRFNQGAPIRQALLDGLGVALVPEFLVADWVADGRLVRLLPGFKTQTFPLHAVYPASRRQVARVEAVVQSLLLHMAAYAQPPKP